MKYANIPAWEQLDATREILRESVCNYLALWAGVLEIGSVYLWLESGKPCMGNSMPLAGVPDQRTVLVLHGRDISPRMPLMAFNPICSLMLELN